MIHADKKEEVVIRYGYINEDDNIDATDALWILQSFVGLRTLDEEVKPAADVNLDGAIDASDALACFSIMWDCAPSFPFPRAKASD